MFYLLRLIFFPVTIDKKTRTINIKVSSKSKLRSIDEDIENPPKSAFIGMQHASPLIGSEGKKEISI